MNPEFVYYDEISTIDEKQMKLLEKRISGIKMMTSEFNRLGSSARAAQASVYQFWMSFKSASLGKTPMRDSTVSSVLIARQRRRRHK